MHLEWDNTASGDLSGPVWDPVHGFPVSIAMLDEEDKVWSSRITGNPTDGFRLEAFPGWLVWDDIFLYMFGLLDPAEVDDAYWKILGMGLPEACVYDEWRTVCDGSSVPITVEEWIPYSTASFIEHFGPRVPAYGEAKTTFDWGALYVSDRVHTEAEVTYLTLAGREYATRSDWAYGASSLLGTVPWPTATRGLGAFRTDYRELVAERGG